MTDKKRRAAMAFHYARDGKNPVRYPAGAMVPVLPHHVAKLVADGAIVPDAVAVPSETESETIGRLTGLPGGYEIDAPKRLRKARRR